MPAATLAVRITAQTTELQKGFAQVTGSIDKFGKSFEGVATRAATVGTLLGTLGAKIATSLAGAFADNLRTAVRLSSEFSNAFTGLSSVARAFGADADHAKDAARRLSADGLLPLKDSATGLKNLLAAGFNLDQSVKLMNAFKDSAAFGRQGALSFGDAVRSATEGVKNGNSILVDNAGVTKNLSQILKEAGFSAQDLSRASSDAGVRMALFNGILRETVAQTGDAQRLTQTYTGQVSRLEAAYGGVLVTLGAAITENATVARAVQAVGDAFLGLNQHLVTNRRAFNLVSEGVIFLFRGLSEILNVVDLVQTGFAGLQQVSNRTFEAFSNIGIVVFKFTERMANLQKYLDPVNFKRHAAGAEEARQAYIFLEGASQGLRDASRDASVRSAALGNALQSVRAKANDLATELKETRGKTVELGAAAGPAGAALGSVGDIADKVSDAMKKLQDRISGVDLVKSAREWESALKRPGAAAAVLADSALRKDLIKAIDDVERRFGTLERAGVASLNRIGGEARALQIAMAPLKNIPITFTVSGLGQPGTLLGDIIPEVPRSSLMSPLVESLKRMFAGIDLGSVAAREALASTKPGVTLPPTFWNQMFSDTKSIGLALGDSIVKAVQGGGNVIASAAGTAGQFFTTKLATYLTAAKDLGGKAIGGFLGGAINAVLPGVGALIGPLVNKITDVFAGLLNRNKGRDLVKDFAASFGGFDTLQKQLGEMGSEGERLWIKLTQGVGRNNPEQAAAAIKEVQEALDAFGTSADRAQRRLDALNTALGGVNIKAELFAAPFRALAESSKDAKSGLDGISAKMAETAQRGQAEFERLGVFVGATFAALVNETGDAIEAIRQLEPAFRVLQQGVREFGLESTGTIDRLIGMFDLVNDAVMGPILSSIQATGQIFTGLQQAGYMTSALFQTVADDIGASFRDLEAKGGDVATAMALSQPVLQALWEAQQRYGNVTDETTQSILDQAYQQGLVGAHMMDVNRQILDVLIAIADVFGAVLPDSLRRTASAADQTARDIENSFSNIDIPPIKIDVEYNDPGFSGSGRVPALAHGGIVRRPTLALVGEAGPEAVVPLSQLGVGDSASTSTFILEMDGRTIARGVVPHIPGEVRRLGLV